MRHGIHAAIAAQKAALASPALPTFHLGSGGSLGGALPWWVGQPAGTGVGGPAEPPPLVAPTGSSGEDYAGGGSGMGRHTEGFVPGSVGSGAQGDRAPSYELNQSDARHLASLIGGLAGIPGGGTLLSSLVGQYGTSVGANNPFPAHTPGVTVTDMDPNRAPTFHYQGYGSDPNGGGFGPDYFGPSRNGNGLNDFSQDTGNYWNTMHPGAGLGNNPFNLGFNGAGAGAAGQGRTITGAAGHGGSIYAGSANPWDWGGDMNRY